MPQRTRILASDRLMRTSRPTDAEGRDLHSDQAVLTASRRPGGVWGLHFRKLVNKQT